MRIRHRLALVAASVAVLVGGGVAGSVVDDGHQFALVAQAVDVSVPCKHMTIPPGGVESGTPGWWVHWFGVDNSSVSNGSEFYAFFSYTFDSSMTWPVNNFESTFDLHVTSTNPAWNGIAVSPILLDFSGGNIVVATNGGGTFNPNQYGNGFPGYNNYQQSRSAPYPIVRGVRYDISVHGIISPVSSVGLIEAYVAPRDGSSVPEPTQIQSVHAATMYNSDPGPLSLYYGFYTKGPQVSGATFGGTFCMPRLGATVAAALAHTPVIVSQWGALTHDPTVVTAAPSLSGSDFAVPSQWGGVAN